jgi:hypothetical protein
MELPVKIPPVLGASPATEQAVGDLIAAAGPLGQYLLSLPASGERDRALVHFNDTLLWAHQAVVRATGGRSILVAPGGSA